MIPVDQEFISDHSKGIYGDCQRACIASLLKLPLKNVPHFLDGLGMDDAATFTKRIQRFLEPLGLCHLETFALPESHFKRDGALGNVNLYHMIYGQSPRGLRHAVVALNGVIVHDPHPTKAGLPEEYKDDWTYGFLVRTGF